MEVVLGYGTQLFVFIIHSKTIDFRKVTLKQYKFMVLLI